MLFTDAQFQITLAFMLFAFLFIVGYASVKKSGGFFLMFAGLTFLYFDTVASSILGTLVSAFLSPFGIFIIILGVVKAFYTDEETGKVDLSRGKKRAKSRR